MRRRSFGDRIITRSFNIFFLALAQERINKFSPNSGRRFFPVKKKVGGFVFIFRTKLEMKFGNEFKKATL